ncbi:MAG: hypothetical protein EXS05_16500 [Planctomycetaceae bacterium]|nr:hypothetical protein [Planctomycetaceae bacterium]
MYFKERSPAIGVVDHLQQVGRPLEAFEILGEVPGQAARCFAVRLRLSEPELEVRERYVVIGIDPLWVYRQEDYDLISHWDHVMPADSADDAKGDGAGETNPTAAPSDE